MAEPNNLPALCSLDEFLKQEYDFIIVGGGTAGLVVAARLTENPNIHVGVLEAGPANIGDPMIMMPSMYVKAIGDPKYDWCHRSVLQKGAFNKSKDQPRGKGLGGSSAINYQMYVRGHALDYDDWAKLGNKGWGFQDLLPYFKKHEHFDEPINYSAMPNIPLETKYDPSFHGHDGPIHTSFSTWRFPQEREWIAASSTLGEKMGSPVDAWNGNHLGVYHSLSTIDRSPTASNGTRSYSVTGYLLPNAHRPNLHVLTEALVTKLEVAGSGAVTGVEFLHSEKPHTVQAKKEVVLSAGVIKSPQILELSGIGNPSILSQVGIKCLVKNVRVGENFQDHIAAGFGYELVEGEKSLDILQNDAVLKAAMTEYTTSKSGPLSSGGAAIGFMSYADVATPEEVAALQESIMSNEYSGHSEPTKKLIAESIADHSYGSIQVVLLPASLNLTSLEGQKEFFQPPADQEGKQGFCIGGAVQRPISVGSIHITTSDPLTDPAIDPGYFHHPADVEIMSKCLEIVAKTASASPLKEKIKRVYHPRDGLDIDNKKQVEEYMRNYCATEYHPIGTVAMGLEGEGACDDRLRVWGCKGLRVVDSSVIPLHVSGNIVATVYAIGEKGADLIKEDWGL